jgi:hypothetical protein
MTRTPRLAPVTLPEFGMPEEEPLLPLELYPARVARLQARMRARGYDRLVVYADREHSASLAYLTGFDPRFEEALLVLDDTGDEPPVLLAGNENRALAAAAPLPVRAVLLAELSLPSQPQHASPSTDEVLAACGIGAGSRVGVVGWKQLGDRSRLDAPAFVVDALRGLVAPSGLVESATDLLIDPRDGLRVVNEAEQLAAFEYASCQTSQGVRGLLHGLRPGLSEREAVALLGWTGAPLSCHLMLTAGERARFGLLSPGDRTLQRGDPFTTAYGIWGALTCRAGFLVEDAAQLPAGASDYVERLVAPYFAAIVEWYEALHVGQTGGVLHEIVHRHLGDPFFGVTLNPGHQIHLDEWVNSPVWDGSDVPLVSGTALQIDVIPATGTPWFTTNIEDGIALADEALRDELAARYPGMWQRVQGRRAFMADVLGIRLHPDVLPFSNLAAWLPPYLLAPAQAMTVA